MIALNLLSPAQKEYLRLRVLFAMLERVMIFTVIGSLLAGIVMQFIRIQLSRIQQDVVSRQILSTEYVSINNEVKRLNDTIGRIERIQAEVVPAPTLLIDVIGRAPAGIAISNITFETRTSSLRMSGQAATREQLLAFEESLRKSPFVKTLDSPISNLFEKKNINFGFQAVLDVPALKRTLEPPTDKATP